MKPLSEKFKPRNTYTFTEVREEAAGRGYKPSKAVGLTAIRSA
jgi:hypothetical protein